MAASWATTSFSIAAVAGPAVERVIVRVDQHRGEIADDGCRVRRLQHLPGVRRVEERVVVRQPARELGECCRETLIADRDRGMRLELTECCLPVLTAPAASLSQRSRSTVRLPLAVGSVDAAAIDNRTMSALGPG